jgi:hypothetical protein
MSSSLYKTLTQIHRQRVSDGATLPILIDCVAPERLLVLLWPQLGDFDSLEYAWWLNRQLPKLLAEGLVIRAIAIGNQVSGQQFCTYTGFPADYLFIDPTAALHHQLGLYPGLTLKVPGLSAAQGASFNLLLMCVGIGSPGTLSEVLRGYTGDRQAPQLIQDEEVVQARPLPPIKGELFARAGGKGFQRPLELATLRLRNMVEVLSHWSTYVPDATYLTQRGATFLFDAQGTLLYEHRDPGILGFAANMSHPLAFLNNISLSAAPSQ